MSANSNDANRLSDGVATATILPSSTKRTGPPGLGHEGEEAFGLFVVYETFCNNSYIVCFCKLFFFSWIVRYVQ